MARFNYHGALVLRDSHVDTTNSAHRDLAIRIHVQFRVAIVYASRLTRKARRNELVHHERSMKSETRTNQREKKDAKPLHGSSTTTARTCQCNPQHVSLKSH